MPRVPCEFDWTHNTLKLPEEEQSEALLVDFHGIFACRGFDKGINQDFNVDTTRMDKRLTYTHNLLTIIGLKEDKLIELAKLYENSIISTLLFSNKSLEQKK